MNQWKNVEMSGSHQKKMIAVAMSGGVDSSVAAVLLKNQGVPIFGITLKLWVDPLSALDHDLDTSAVDDAKKMADFLDIPHHVLDFRDRFRDDVIGYFIDAYSTGITPNPCPVCNNTIKFGGLLDQARALGAEFLATGHYAQILETNGEFQVHKGVDPIKDQSYFLYQLTQERLKYVKFPLGGFHKQEIRQIAEEFDLPVKNKPESQDICFIENNNYRDFLSRHANQTFKEGPIVSAEGQVVGRHKGLAFYTIGQRKGLGVAMGRPAYVTQIDFENNTLIIGEDKDRQKFTVRVDCVNYISDNPPIEPIEISVKIRSTTKAVPALLTPLSDRKAQISSFEPLLDVAPGQSAVFYIGDSLVGGGIIQKE